MSNITRSTLMKKILLIILMLIFAIILNALGTLRVDSIEELPTEHMNLEVRDADGKWAAVLIVKTELRNLGFRSVSRPIIQPAKYDEGKHEYTFYLNDNQRVIEITHSDYEALEVRLLADFGIEVKSQRVYELVMVYTEEVIPIPVIISCNEDDAQVLVDGKEIGKISNGKLTTNISSGKRSIRIEKEDFASQEIEADISLENNTFSFDMLPTMPSTVKITTEPSGAKIYLDDLYFGESPVENFYNSGTYSIRIEKQNYDTIEEMIIITDPETSSHYELEDIRAKLTIRTDPVATVTFDGQEYPGGFADKLLLPQAISFRIDQEFCESIDQIYTLKKGENKVFELYPKDTSSTLTINTHPEAMVKLKGKSYKGGIQKLRLIPQTISFKIEQEFCETIIKTYTLQKSENKIFELYPDDISAYLTIKTHPDATVKFNGISFKGGITNYRIIPQVLTIQVEQLKADPIEKIVNIRRGSTKVLELYPEIKTGSILITVIPSDASIELMGDAGEEFIGIGRENFTDIPIGRYTLKVHKTDYIPFEENLHLKLNDTITESVKLEKANYKLRFTNKTSERITDLDFKITKDNIVKYQGKGKTELSVSESGNYSIDVTKGNYFAFDKSITINMSRKAYNIELVNFIEIETEERKQRNKERLVSCYRICEVSNEKGEIYDEYYLKNPCFGLINYDFGPSTNISIYVTGTLIERIIDGGKENSDWIRTVLLNKFSVLSSNIEKKRFSFYWGISMVYNFMTSTELYYIDIGSVNCGAFIRSENHSRQLILECDMGFRIYGLYETFKNGDKIYYAKESGQSNEVPFVKWSPGSISFKYYQFLSGKTFCELKLGIRLFTNIGGSTKATWFYKENDLAIDGNPDHPLFKGILPYFGISIGF